MLLIHRLSNEARLFQSLQAVGKNVGRNAFGRILQLSIGHIAPEQIPNHKQRPLVANQVERACDRAGRAQKTARFRFRFYPFTVAVSIGALGPLLAPNFYGAVSTAPMTQLPLVLVPTYLVPTFLILHLTALFQARRLPATSTANLMGKSGASGDIRISQTA